MKATIVTIGDEILIGQILDTNTRYISQALNRIGIVVHQQISIGDTAQQITTTLDQALSTTDLTIITGGLGPTKDDITKHTLTAYFNSELVYNQEVGDFVSQLLARRGIAFTELNRGQAMVPKCCTVLHNAHGTAPGMMFERDGKIVISLPGVPFEMRHLIDDKVIPMLAERFTLKSIIHRTMITSGIPESLLAERIAAWEDALPEMLHLAYLPAPNIVRLRLSAYQVEGQSVGKIIDQQFELLRQIIPQAVVGFEDASV
ncbi:MAG: damage-inducible protein CinA, partial [Alistipes sp.]|nr:damage-inducible protein CinA [Alistipes sp.]